MCNCSVKKANILSERMDARLPVIKDSNLWGKKCSFEATSSWIITTFYDLLFCQDFYTSVNNCSGMYCDWVGALTCLIIKVQRQGDTLYLIMAADILNRSIF